MKKQRCFYDYGHKCDCSEDDKCGCTYPENMSADWTCQNVASEEKQTETASPEKA